MTSAGATDPGSVVGCYACDLSAGRIELPGGLVHATAHWRVEHCTGPLGVGALIVKPVRHVLHPWSLDDDELAGMGPLLGRSARVVHALTACDQVYTCQWSHGDYVPVHLHFVVQPVHRALREAHPRAGPALQCGLFDIGVLPDPDAVETFCRRARAHFAGPADATG